MTSEELDAIAERASRELVNTSRLIDEWLYDNGFDPAIGDAVRRKISIYGCFHCLKWRPRDEVDPGDWGKRIPPLCKVHKKQD